MKVEVPEGAVQTGRGEDGRIAVMFSEAGIERAVMLDPQEFKEGEAQELGAMLWRVMERWLVARQAVK